VVLGTLKIDKFTNYNGGKKKSHKQSVVGSTEIKFQEEKGCIYAAKKWAKVSVVGPIRFGHLPSARLVQGEKNSDNIASGGRRTSSGKETGEGNGGRQAR